jgi:HEAT repeat protein
MKSLFFIFCGVAALYAQPFPSPAPVPPNPPSPAPAPFVFVDGPLIAAQVKANVAQIMSMKDRTRGEERNYRDGTRYLDRGEWDKAVEAFTAAIEAKGERLDGAYYWKAYALGKVGKRDEAIALINELEKNSPKSRWLDDAKALRIELRQASGQPLAADIQNDEELKLIALNGLVDSAPDRAIPALRDLLKKSSSPRLKERALFVLAQSGTPQGREIIAQYAKGAGNPDLQLKAVEYLGMHRGKENLPLLAEIYSSNTDPAVRRRVLRAYMNAREKDRLLEAAKSEPDPDLRREAIMFLGAMRAEPELQQLYAAESKPELRRHILHGLMAAQSAKGIIEIARKETNPELKREAVQMLSNMRSKEATDYLMELINK